MTEHQAETVANVLLGAAAAAGAVYVLKTPGLRRTAFRAARTALAATCWWIVAEARQVWHETRGGRGSQPQGRTGGL